MEVNKTLLKGGLVLKSWDSEPEKLDIEIKDGVVKKLGDLQGNGVNMCGKLIMPAFYNTHTHSPMTLMRGISDDEPFEKWLFERVLPLESRLDGSMVYWGTMIAMMEMASKGIAGFVDMYFFLDDIVKAVLDFGMKAVITRGLVDDNGEDDGRLEENLRAFRRWHGEASRIKIGLGPHSPYTCSLDYLKRIADVAKAEGIMVTMHLREVSWEKDRYDLEEILKIFENVDFLAVHMVHVDEREIELLKKFEVSVSHNPTSNLKLGNGISPVGSMLRKGVRVGLGTDGSASNNSLDIWHEMRIATLLQKLSDPTIMTPSQALKMATEFGARITGFGTGRIEEGEPADLVVVDLDKPHYEPLGRLKSHLVHSGNSGDVYATMVNGEWVYIDGEFPKADKEIVFGEFQKSYRRLMGTI